MDDTFDDGYESKVFAQWMRSAQKATKGQFKSIRVSVQDGFGPFAPRDGIRLMGMLQNDPLGEETALIEEHIAKQVIRGKNVTFMADNDTIGRMSVITDTSQDINADPLFIEKPILMQALIAKVVAYVVEKYTPPQKDTVPANG
ncbi:hypothetical protein [Tetrasphaera phage TJE1]|uniref:Uncharacterized protein n=1 Tax=Tetrasphaera phage TJE1 TaxID=981335 RepID=G4W966_9CAUD|nr:hypothetical protein G185_gp34 [Tetrasphaera phage TJE1]ADX42554.1 hypothetical protein [Tetrasphaera phage TJE1]